MQDMEVCLQIVTNVGFYNLPGAHKLQRPSLLSLTIHR